MRTTLDLPEELLKEAMRLTHTKTKTAVIISALEDLIRKAQIKEIQDFRGKVNMNINLDDLRKRQ